MQDSTDHNIWSLLSYSLSSFLEAIHYRWLAHVQIQMYIVLASVRTENRRRGPDNRIHHNDIKYNNKIGFLTTFHHLSRYTLYQTTT